MKDHYIEDHWSIIEEGFHPVMQEASESIFSLGNGSMGQRANFEEQYSGETLQGNYLAGVYYPDKTRVGWWKNGYPEYFAKVLNAPNWIGIDVEIDGDQLDLHKCELKKFRRELNMRQGYLERTFTVVINGKILNISVRRFLSMKRDEIGVIRYGVKSLDYAGKISFTPYIDGNVVNRDSNYDEHFWEMENRGAEKGMGFLMARTRKSGFVSCMTMGYELIRNQIKLDPVVEVIEKPDFIANRISMKVEEGDEVVFYKYASVLTSMNHDPLNMEQAGRVILREAMHAGFDTLFEEHAKVWENNWAHSDIIIEGDTAAQQGIRFNIFQLNQTYTGKDERLNIGPKGFTGEKYGGSTYWDTEAYMIPFYLSTATQDVARKLLVYRYKHLEKAIENGEKLGFENGAALYPMVTMNGEECHNEWEITFEEIHRNGAIAFAIYNYIRYTGDKEYLAEFGLEVLIGISRFWRQRVNWSDEKGKYVMLGVTGPNEYENNVNNNWYTNKIASWTLKYTLEALDHVKEKDQGAYDQIKDRTGIDFSEETTAWSNIIENLHFPFNENKNVFLQQDGYMDKEQIMAADLDPAQKPINQHWSWDRILRSCFIKQADVLQGIYLFEDEYDVETIKRNFEFYEPRTVHESSLSPCVHSILASRTGKFDKAYEMYLRTSRLDLDDYNNEVKEGLHITSMGGTWMSVVYGFGGMKIREGLLSFDPQLPHQWKGLSFNILYRGRILKVNIEKGRVTIENLEGKGLDLYLVGSKTHLDAHGSVVGDI
ncbi:MAG: family 65 glycosyl hydrolase domain-containing protein [Deltaproteobacteria bacterium]|jgi:maltose phosphorylase|nr:family 65 glycosyl hydrolase domain-containing protein [Deltaproteobacteria bacterium]